MKRGLADPRQFESFVDLCKERALEAFNQRGHVNAHALVLGTFHPTTHEDLDGARAFPCVPTELLGPGDVAGFIDFVRHIAIDTKAIGVIFVNEVWQATSDEPEATAELERLFVQTGGGAHAIAGAHEAILISIDHLLYGHTVRWLAPIVRDAAGRGRAERFQKVPPEDVLVRERFSDAFPRELWQ